MLVDVERGFDSFLCSPLSHDLSSLADKKFVEGEIKEFVYEEIKKEVEPIAMEGLDMAMGAMGL